VTQGVVSRAGRNQELFTLIGITKQKLNTCWFCEEPNKAAAWREGRAVCAHCDALMTQGVICIGVNEPITRDIIVDKIYRDGNWCVLSRDEFVRRFNYLPAERYDYIPLDKWIKQGLPRFGKHGASHNNDNLSNDAASLDEPLLDRVEGD
jgi:hypothetical protein